MATESRIYCVDRGVLNTVGTSTVREEEVRDFRVVAQEIVNVVTVIACRAIQQVEACEMDATLMDNHRGDSGGTIHVEVALIVRNGGIVVMNDNGGVMGGALGSDGDGGGVGGRHANGGKRNNVVSRKLRHSDIREVVHRCVALVTMIETPVGAVEGNDRVWDGVRTHAMIVREWDHNERNN